MSSPASATKLLAALSGLDADVIGLNELENTTGVEPLASIVSGLPGYPYIATGTIGADAIKVGMIYRPAVVTPVGDFQTADLSGRPAVHRHQESPVTSADLRSQCHRGALHRGRQSPQSPRARLVPMSMIRICVTVRATVALTRRAAAEALVDRPATDPIRQR